MRCPKCGGQMDEKRLETILVDECAGCGGIYFDKDELSILLKHEKASSGILRKLFGA
jgi:Zn-finger nucleic acid-binding protein